MSPRRGLTEGDLVTLLWAVSLLMALTVLGYCRGERFPVLQVFALAVALAAVASNDPQADPRPIDKARSLGQVDNVTTQVDAANTECLASTGGGSTCGLYSMGAVTPVTPSAVGTACFSQSRLRVAIGVQAAETAGSITLDGVTEPCSGWTFVAAAATHDLIPETANLQLKGFPTYSGRYCDLTARGMGGGFVHPPCGYGLQTQLFTTPASPTNSATYNVVLNATNVAAATDGSATQTELRDALITAINGSAQASVLTAATSGNNVLVTSDVGGLAFTAALGSQPASPLVLSTAVTVQAANDAECVTVSAAGATCLLYSNSLCRQWEAEGVAASYLFVRPLADATRFSAVTER